MKIILSNQIEITTENTQQIIRKFTFDNPKYKEAISFGRSTRGIDKKICLIECTENNQLIAPLGIHDYLLQVFKAEVIDERQIVPVNIPFNGTLRPYQCSFIGSAIDAGGGQMVAATGSGKTVCSIAMASRLQQRTLILVKSKDLAKQWIEAIKQFTGLDAE